MESDFGREPLETIESRMCTCQIVATYISKQPNTVKYGKNRRMADRRSSDEQNGAQDGFGTVEKRLWTLRRHTKICNSRM